MPGNAAIGSRMAQRMGLRLGSQLTLISPKGAATAFGTRAADQDLHGRRACSTSGMYEYDNSFVYIPLSDAQTYLPAAGHG